MIGLISEKKEIFVDNPSQFGITMLNREELETPFGIIKYYVGLKEDKKFYYFPECGKSQYVNYSSGFLGIFFIIQKLGIKKVVEVCKVGGLNPLLNVGDILLPDCFYDATVKRSRSYYQALDDKISLHYTMNDPFCKDMKADLMNAVKKIKVKFPGIINNVFDKGRYVCTEGPGFESGAEVSVYRSFGMDVVGHTVAPLVYYARELEVCFNVVTIISNINAGYHEISNTKALDHSDFIDKFFSELFLSIVEHIDTDRTCTCNYDNFWLRRPIKRENSL